LKDSLPQIDNDEALRGTQQLSNHFANKELLSNSLRPFLELCLLKKKYQAEDPDDVEIIQEGNTILTFILHYAFAFVSNATFSRQDSTSAIVGGGEGIVTVFQMILEHLECCFLLPNESVCMNIGNLLFEIVTRTVTSSNQQDITRQILVVSLRKLFETKVQVTSQSLLIFFLRIALKDLGIFDMMLSLAKNEPQSSSTSELPKKFETTTATNISNTTSVGQRVLLMFCDKWLTTIPLIVREYYLKVACVTLIQVIVTGDKRFQNVFIRTESIQAQDQTKRYNTRSNTTKKFIDVPFAVQGFLEILNIYNRLLEDAANVASAANQEGDCSSSEEEEEEEQDEDDVVFDQQGADAKRTQGHHTDKQSFTEKFQLAQQEDEENYDDDDNNTDELGREKAEVMSDHESDEVDYPNEDEENDDD